MKRNEKLKEYISAFIILIIYWDLKWVKQEIEKL